MSFLHKEVDRLQALLNSKDIPMTQPIMKQHLSLEEKVSVFRNLFKGREGCVCTEMVQLGQVENQVTSQCAGMNGTGNCVTRKSISAQNVPTGCSNR